MKSAEEIAELLMVVREAMTTDRIPRLTGEDFIEQLKTTRTMEYWRKVAFPEINSQNSS
jgi:hypothetical protein